MQKSYVAPDWDVRFNPTTPQQVLERLENATGLKWTMEVKPSKNLILTLVSDQDTLFLTCPHDDDRPEKRRVQPGKTAFFRAWFLRGQFDDSGEEKCVYNLIYRDDRFTSMAETH